MLFKKRTQIIFNLYLFKFVTTNFWRKGTIWPHTVISKCSYGWNRPL